MKQKKSIKRKLLKKTSQSNTCFQSNADIEDQHIISAKANAVISDNTYQNTTNTPITIHKVSVDYISFTVPISA